MISSDAFLELVMSSADDEEFITKMADHRETLTQKTPDTKGSDS